MAAVADTAVVADTVGVVEVAALTGAAEGAVMGGVEVAGAEAMVGTAAM